MSKFSLVIIIILLSVAVTLISGILLPTYLSRQILKLRKELNSRNSNSKYSLLVNKVPVENRHNQSDKISVPSQTVETGDFRTNSIQSPEKAKKRSKRQALSGDDYVEWNFNFNLTEHRNKARQVSSEVASDSSDKIKPLGIAIFTEGGAKRKTAFSDIQYSLKAVEYFFKYLFNAENYTHEEAEAAHSETDFPKHDAGSETLTKGREGKFFNLGSLNIFGFRRTPEKISSTSQTATNSVFERDDLVTTEFPQMDIFTENAQEIQNLSNFQAQSLTAEKQNLLNVSNLSDLNLPGKTEDGECIDCDAENLETQITSNTNQTNALPATETTTEFTDEFLEMFCMSLVNKVGISQHLSDSEDINFNPTVNTAEEHDVVSFTENPLSDILPTLVLEKELNPQFVAEGSGVSDILVPESDRQKKFLSLSSFLGFGSGRAAADETNESTSEAFANEIDLGNLPTLVDCENYFRKKNIKMFSKPNLMDIISDPKIQFADFENATISSKVIEQQLQFLTSLLKTNLGNTVETFGRNSDDAVTKSVFDETFENSKSTLKDLPKEMSTESNDFIGNTKTPIMGIDFNEDLTTELRKDGRFINIFGFGSGDGESRSQETIFGADKSEGLGSGDLRSFEAVDFGTDIKEFGSGDERLLRDTVLNSDSKEKFGSGDSRLLRTDLFSSDRDELGSGNLRSLGDKLFDSKEKFGSGDSRSLWAVLFGSDRDELGSGNLRSLGDKIFDGKEKFGSGDSRSFWAALFGSDRDELGSGNLRSLEDAVFDADRNEKLGSGDSRSLGEEAFVTEINELGIEDFGTFGNETSGNDRDEFGSGELRSLKAIAFGTERNEFGSGDFKENPDLHENLKLNSTNKQRFWGILGLAGSGDGRSLPENSKISQSENECENCTDEFTNQRYDCEYDGCNTSSSERDRNLLEVQNSIKESGCDGDCMKTDTVAKNETFDELKSISLDYHGQDCQGCNNESLSNVNKSTTLVEFSECDECNSSSSSFNIPQRNLQTEESLVIDANIVNTDNFETGINTTNSDSINDFADKENAKSEIHTRTESPQEQTTDKNTVRFLGPIFLTGSGDGGLFSESGGPINLLEEEESTNNKDNNAGKENKDSEAQNVSENTHDGQLTEKNDRRFLKPIFLTGSGDGGLFEDSGGPINLIEEETTVKPQNFSLKKARLNDPFEFSEAVRESSVQNSSTERPINGNITTEKLTSPITPSSRRNRMEDKVDEYCDDCEYDYEDFIENYRKNQKPNHNKSENITDHDINENANKFKKRTNIHSVEEIPLTNINKIPVTVSTDVMQSKKPFIPDLTLSRFPTRSCRAARECNSTLNERCVTINSLRVCGCSKGYARSIETSKCVVKKIVQTTIKLPSEHFEDDLRNSSSRSFQQKRKSSVELMVLLLQHDPEMLRILSEIDEVKFSSGSLVITLSLVFAAENKSEDELIKRLEDDLLIALRNETLSKSVSLDISDASLVSVNGSIDYCKSSELNYCSEHAYCVSNPALPASYACHCKEHYRDASFDPRHFGETCLAKCPKEYCGLYGHCELLANDKKICLCSGLYFGRRCEVPGLYVLIILGCLGFISITMLIVVVCKRRCSKFSYRGSQARETEENAINSNASARVSDAIALEENIGTARFMNISTPMPHPAIKVIRPTVTESGSSYEFDSTFDSNHSALKSEEDTTV